MKFSTLQTHREVARRRMANMVEQILVSRRQAAAMLGISIRSLDHAVVGGLLKPTRLGKRVMFRPEQLWKFAGRDHARLAPPASKGRDGR